MHSMRLAASRSGARAGLLCTVGAVSLVLTALVVGLIGYLNYSGTVNTRAFVSASDSTASSVRVETKLSVDAAAQTAAADRFFDQEFAGLPFTLTRTTVDFPLPATRGGVPLNVADGSEGRITAGSDAGLEKSATLMNGRWSAESSGDGSSDSRSDGDGDGSLTSPFAGALQADAAKQLGLAVGDVLSLGVGSEAKFVMIAGTWRPKNAQDPRWFSDQGVATGNAVAAGDGTASFGPLMISERALTTLGPVPSVHWTVAIDPHQVTPAGLDRAGTIATNLRKHLIDDGTLGKGDILVNGMLAQTAKTVNANLASVSGVTPVGILLVALMGLIALVQLARLLSLSRRPENALLRSRGASARWLTTAGVAEAASVAVLGCGLGYAASAGALFAISGASVVPFAPWEVAVLTTLAVLLIFGMTAFLDSIRLAKRDAIDDSGRTRTAATFGTAVFAIAAAGVAVWQSLLYGSPLLTDAAGRTSVNPLAVVAPTLALIAFAFVVLVIFGPLASVWQRIAAARRGLQPSYSSRQIARGLGSYAVAVLVVVLATGGAVVASGYSGSWQTLSERNAELVSGADARVTLTAANLPLAGALPVTGSEFLAVPGVSAAAPVLSTPITIGDDGDGRLTAIPRDAISAVVASAGGIIHPDALAEAVGDVGIRGIELPAGTQSLSLTLTVKRTSDLHEGPRRATTDSWVQAGVWLRNPEGAIITTTFSRIDVASLGDGGTVTQQARFDLPHSDSAWWLVAIDYAVQAASGDFTTSFSDLAATTASGPQHVALDTTAWGVPLLNSFGFGADSRKDGLTVSVPSAGGYSSTLRYVAPGVEASGPPPGFTGSWFTTPEPLALVVSTQLAAHYDVGKGDPLTVRFAGTGLTLNGKIAAVVSLLPGIQSPNAVFVDLNALNETLLGVSATVPSANQIWLAANGPVALGSALPKGASVVTPKSSLDNTFAAPAELALWIAAIGCLLLAAISLGAVALTVDRARRGEVAVLRAVGIAARQQSRSRFAELAAVIMISMIFGVLGGLAVCALTVPNLAHSAVHSVPHGLPASLAFALTTGGALLFGALMVMLGIAAVSAARVRRAALNTSERLETR